MLLIREENSFRLYYLGGEGVYFNLRSSSRTDLLIRSLELLEIYSIWVEIVIITLLRLGKLRGLRGRLGGKLGRLG